MDRKRQLTLAFFISAALWLLGIVAVGAAPVRQEAVTVGIFQAALVALGYYLANSPWLANMGFVVFYRPLMAGTVVGFIFGDPVQGAIIGGTINLIYLGFISAGGSQPGDIALAGWLGTALALGAGLDQNAALAIAAPLGLLGTFNFASRMSYDAIFAHWADARAEEGDIWGMARMNWLPPQVVLFLVSFPAVFIAAYAGIPLVSQVFDWLNVNAPWVLGWLFAVGGWLPALGIAINLRLILRLETTPYFFLGFFAFALAGVNLVVLAVIFLSLGILHVYFTKGGFGRG